MTYLGLDHHKRWTQIAAIDDQGEILREGRVDNDQRSLENFLKDLPKPLHGVIEAGPSWTWIYQALTQLSVATVVAHPFKVRAIAEAKIKNDKIDALMLAQLLRGKLIPEVYVPASDIRNQKLLWRERTWVVRMRVRLKNRIHRLLSHYHVNAPETSDLFGNMGKKFLAGLNLPSPGNKILASELKLLEVYEQSIKDLHKAAKEESKGHPLLPYLESLPGFGDVFAPMAAIEIDSIDRFATAEKLASYCGLVPSLHSSGGKSWHGPIGRQGNHWLKWAFIEAAWTAIRTSPYFKLYYQRLRHRKPAQVAVIACARRLSEIAFHLLRDKRFYEERRPAYA